MKMAIVMSADLAAGGCWSARAWTGSCHECPRCMAAEGGRLRLCGHAARPAHRRHVAGGAARHDAELALLEKLATQLELEA